MLPRERIRYVCRRRLAMTEKALYVTRVLSRTRHPFFVLKKFGHTLVTLPKSALSTVNNYSVLLE